MGKFQVRRLGWWLLRRWQVYDTGYDNSEWCRCVYELHARRIALLLNADMEKE